MFRHVVFVWMALVCLYLTIDFNHAYADGKGVNFFKKPAKGEDSAEISAADDAKNKAIDCARRWGAQLDDECKPSLMETAQNEIANPPKITAAEFMKIFRLGCADELECSVTTGIGNCTCITPGCPLKPRETNPSLCDVEIKALNDEIDKVLECLNSGKCTKTSTTPGGGGGSSFVIASGAVVVFAIMIIVSANTLLHFQQ